MCSCQTLHGVGMVTRRSNNLNQDRYGGPLKKAWQSHVCYDFFLQPEKDETEPSRDEDKKKPDQSSDSDQL